ncbi:hypothetical protein [Streptacidiphilus sp. MAP5-3]|uniref:Rv1733c family protein n=1 Tax=unclassified Streptacidiphilus TaxID=2643834 RepID=UPI003513237F
MVKFQFLAVLAAAVLGTLIGMSVYQQGRAHTLDQARHLHPVQARIVGQPYMTGVGGEVAEVSWTAADGKVQRSVVSVPAAVGPADQVRVWLDASGSPAAAPTSALNTGGTAALVGVLAMLGGDIVLVSAGSLVRWRLNRRDEEAWEAEWQVFEPLWSRRR